MTPIVTTLDCGNRGLGTPVLFGQCNGSGPVGETLFDLHDLGVCEYGVAVALPARLQPIYHRVVFVGQWRAPFKILDMVVAGVPVKVIHDQPGCFGRDECHGDKPVNLKRVLHACLARPKPNSEVPITNKVWADDASRRCIAAGRASTDAPMRRYFIVGRKCWMGERPPFFHRPSLHNTHAERN